MKKFDFKLVRELYLDNFLHRHFYFPLCIGKFSSFSFIQKIALYIRNKEDFEEFFQYNTHKSILTFQCEESLKDSATGVTDFKTN